MGFVIISWIFPEEEVELRLWIIFMINLLTIVWIMVFKPFINRTAHVVGIMFVIMSMIMFAAPIVYKAFEGDNYQFESSSGAVIWMSFFAIMFAVCLLVADFAISVRERAEKRHKKPSFVDDESLANAAAGDPVGRAENDRS